MLEAVFSTDAKEFARLKNLLRWSSIKGIESPFSRLLQNIPQLFVHRHTINDLTFASGFFTILKPCDRNSGYLLY
jgi:hypothetical protein